MSDARRTGLLVQPFQRTAFALHPIVFFPSSNATMVVSRVQAARRALVTLLLALGEAYNIAVVVSRESPDAEMQKAYRRVAARVHPDKGGSADDSKKLNAMRDTWQRLRSCGAPDDAAPPTTWKRPASSSATVASAIGGTSTPTTSSMSTLSTSDSSRRGKAYRIQGVSTLLTYQGLPTDAIGLWTEFKKFVREGKRGWGVKHWCATLESNDNGKCHLHLMLQFHQPVDRTVNSFVFLGYRPNASAEDYMGMGCCRKRMQASIDRGMFYVWADKIGTRCDGMGALCVDGNYFPCWVPGAAKYSVQGRWLDTLWRSHKLTHDVYEKYVYLCRDGVVARLRNLQAVRTHETEDAENRLIESNTKKLRSDPDVYRPFPVIPAAVTWLALFQKDAFRYPLLIVVGPSHSGKTQWANSLFHNALEVTIGTLAYFPEKLRKFDRNIHDGLVLDDVRDMEFLSSHQEKLQSSCHRAVEFASTPGGTCAFQKYLFKIPIAVTVNHSTANLRYLWEHDWLKQDANRIVVEWPAALSAAVASAS